MKIMVKSIFEPNEIELDTRSTTLGALLDELSHSHKITTAQFFDSRLREIYSNYKVVINGNAMNDGLNTELKDGDRIEVYMIMRGDG
jgi:molybdopterin converting factor small subunit